jgi:hypothetical protein
MSRWTPERAERQRERRQAARWDALARWRCELCGEAAYEPYRSTRRYCSDMCRQRAYRLRNGLASRWGQRTWHRH